MAKNPKEGKLLYHITAFDNLDSIFENGLLPRNKINFNIKDVANDEILGSRKKFDLAEYTPFHFFSPTPFAGAAQMENRETDFVYITIKKGLALENNFKIIPSHPLNYDDEPLEWNKGIDEINWDLMSLRDYNNHECKESCMAEAIFQGKIPAKFFFCLYVKSEEIKEKVVSLLEFYNLDINVNINNFFFKR
jgi:hypothetical protein